MSSDYSLRAFIALNPGVSADDVRLALRDALEKASKATLSPDDIDRAFSMEDDFFTLEVDDHTLSAYLDFDGDHQTCLILALALTPLAQGPGYFKLYDQSAAPSNDEALNYYELGATPQERRASRIRAAFDEAQSIASNALVDGQLDRFLALRDSLVTEVKETA